MQRLLWLASRHARACLILGLLAGLAFPSFAQLLVPWLPHMVAILLTITALRIGHGAAMGAKNDWRWGSVAVVTLQFALPLLMYGILSAFGVQNTPAALAIILAVAAPTITGSVNLALLMKLDAGRLMQLLILGTAVFPVTILPVLAVLPQLGDPTQIIWAAVRLLVVILIATGLGFGLRAVLFPNPTDGQIKALDGLSVLAFSFIVVGLMAALTPALLADPWLVMKWTALAFAIGHGMQILTLLALRRSPLRSVAGPLALAAGNRNIAIFLVALPAEILAPLMIFIGCWQLPMYLTPMLLPRVYAWALRDE